MNPSGPDIPLSEKPPAATDVSVGPVREPTAHLKRIPETIALRNRIRDAARQFAAKLDKSEPIGHERLAQAAREVLEHLGLSESYLGWTMVLISTAFWADQVAAVPFSRRLLLLPHCLRDQQTCRAEMTPEQLHCLGCGDCHIGSFRAAAEQLGYRVLVAEGSPIVMKMIVQDEVDAIIGVACLDVLEKMLDRVLATGIPCIALPLTRNGCNDTRLDASWLHDILRMELHRPVQRTHSYLPLIRLASEMFQPEWLDRLAPRRRDPSPDGTIDDPIAATEAIAYDFLAQGGKHFRPFITLAVFDALAGEPLTKLEDDSLAHPPEPPIAQLALSIETFHKASLVHDDIEDDDAFRYGRPTVHRQYGSAMAINVGDYLIGLGYRLIASAGDGIGPEAAADILQRLSEAHMRLCEGQGAELWWRDAEHKELTPLDALKIYALKTAPAFEVALYAGARAVGPAAAYRESFREFAKNVGIAYQILNDLNDWSPQRNNKRRRGTDLLGRRPTILRALGGELLDPAQRRELDSLLVEENLSEAEKFAAARAAYQKAGVFEKADRLVDKYQVRAEHWAERIQPKPLQRLFHYLIETVLQRPEGELHEKHASQQ